MTQHAELPTRRAVCIRDEAEDRPSIRRKIVAACALAAVAIHGALAAVPLNFGGSAAEYGIAPGVQIEVTLMVETEAPGPGVEPAVASTAPEPPPAEPVADMQVASAEEPVVDVTQPAPSLPAIQPSPQTAAKPAAASTPSARTTGSGERTLAKPDYLRNPPPQYPAESRKLREQGVVLLKVAVTENGRAADVQLQRSSGFPRLDQAALKAVRRWEFKPARAGLTAVACAVEVPVRFGLN
ncbi:MAG TPA: TonB family protein [Chthoniobacterales bacterium]|nr:TonB family protein [Chthoniobacterales bacterium]